MSGERSLLVRLDDVVDAGAAVQWICRLCRDLGLFVSLQAIPYLARLRGATLDRLDPDCRLDVAQHGYAHLPEPNPTGPGKGEFAGSRGLVTAEAMLQRGMNTLQRSVGDRFTGGYAAPYDGLPAWLPAVWRRLGGRFLSWIWNAPPANVIPHVRLSLDPWDWKQNDSKPVGMIVDKTLEAIRSTGRIGLVLHPQTLAIPDHRRLVASYLEAAVGAGARPKPLARCVIGGPWTTPVE